MWVETSTLEGAGRYKNMSSTAMAKLAPLSSIHLYKLGFFLKKKNKDRVDDKSQYILGVIVKYKYQK